jgi:hypothetical protein
MGAPATSGGGGMMSGAVNDLDPGLSVILGGSTKARGPGLGMICDVEAGELGGQLAGDALPFDELATHVTVQMLAIADCKNWKTETSQLSLRSIHYERQMLCECAMVKALQHGKTTEGAHPITGKEFDVGLSQTAKANSTITKLWDMIKRRGGLSENNHREGSLGMLICRRRCSHAVVLCIRRRW